MLRPSDREIRIAAALFVPAGLAACLLALLAGQLGIGPDAAEGIFGWRRATLLAVGLLAVGAAALVTARPGLVSRPDRWERMRVLPGYLAIGLLALVGITLVWTRLIHIDESLAHDAAFTALTYIDGGPGAILFGEESFDVNNHVAYNLLTWVTVDLLGISEAVYRLWSVLPAIAAIALGAWWAWRRVGPVASIAFAALAVAAPLHLELASDARGYGLAILAATLMLIAADRLTRAYSLRMFLGFLAAGLLGIWTLFIFALAFVGQAVSLLRMPALRRPVLAMVGVAGVLSLAFYGPVLRDVFEARTLGESIPLWDALILRQALEWLAVPSFALVARVEPAWWMSLGTLALVVLAVVHLWRRGDFGLALILVVPPLLYNLFFGITGLETVARHQFILLPYLLLLVGIGIAALAGLVTRYRPLYPIAVVAGTLAILALSQAVIEQEHGEDTPPENFKEAASVVHWSGTGEAVTDSLRPTGLRFYLGDLLTQTSPQEVEALLCDEDEDGFAYIRHVPFPPEQWGIWAPASLECLIDRDAVRVRVPQRTRGAAIDVWIVASEADRETVEDDLGHVPDSGAPTP